MRFQELISQHPSSPWQREQAPELSLGGPLSLVQPAVVLAKRVGFVVPVVGVGGGLAVGKVTPIMGNESKHCHHLSHVKVRINFLVIIKYLVC